MDISIISQRYAQALFDLAIEMKNLERVYSDILLVLDVTRENPEFRRLLTSPVIPPGKKSQILKGIFEKHLDRLTFRFLQLVTKKERAVHLENIAKSFVSIYKKYNNILITRLKTAVPVDAETRKKIIDLVTGVTHKNIELIEKIDEKLIGGFVLTLDDRQYDASLSKKISILSKSFDKNLYIKGY
jgi:F-type H+-transporting ATPase subunit delta